MEHEQIVINLSVLLFFFLALAGAFYVTMLSRKIMAKKDVLLIDGNLVKVEEGSIFLMSAVLVVIDLLEQERKAEVAMVVKMMMRHI